MNRCTWVFAVCFLTGWVVPQEKAKEEPKPQPQSDQQIKRIQDLVELLESRDEEARKIAYVELLRIGKPALSYLEEKMVKKGAGQAAILMKQILIRESRRLDFTRERWVDENELSKELPKDIQLSSEVTRKYVEARYKEAFGHYERGRFDQALKIASALLDLEPRSALVEELYKLKRVCDQKILQQTLLKAQIFVNKEAFEAGEIVRFTLRITNVGPQPIVLKYADKPTVFIRVYNSFHDPVGLETGLEGSEVVVFESSHEVPISPGAEREITYSIDTGKPMKGFFERVNAPGTTQKGDDTFDELVQSPNFRTYAIEAWTDPMHIEVGLNKVVKNIVFEPTLAKVGPKGVGEALKDLPKALTKALDKKNPYEIFICAMMLKKDQMEIGIDLLISALKRYTPKEKVQRFVIMNSLRRLTGNFFDTEAQWTAWWEQESKKKKSEKK